MSSSLVIFTKLANFVNMSTKCYREGVLEDFRLRIFMAVAEKGSFTLAAKALGVSQPAVSQNIAELEKSLFAEGNPTGIKAALSIKGLIANNLRLPLVASSPELSDRIRLLASEAGL